MLTRLRFCKPKALTKVAMCLIVQPEIADAAVLMPYRNELDSAARAYAAEIQQT